MRNRLPEPIPDMPIQPQDYPFVNAIRQAVDDWLAEDPLTRTNFLSLPPETTPPPMKMNSNHCSSAGLQVKTSTSEGYSFPPSLSRYQMRLIYQTVRNEYDKRVVALGNRNWIQLILYDQKRQDALKADQEQYKEKDISKATEFRWLVEALAGGDITKINTNIFRAAISSDTAANDASVPLKDYIDGLQTKLNNRRRILVGHNLFTDLIMIYQCFIGDLPDSVQDFQRNVHNLFPTIIDTKFLATRGTHRGSEGSTLEDLEFNLQDRAAPVLEVPPEFDGYSASASYHEAGFDSLLTAKVAIKLSTQIEAKKQYEADVAVRPPSSGSEAEFHTPIESGSEQISRTSSMLSSITSLFSAAVKSMKSPVPEYKLANSYEPTIIQNAKISPPKDLRPIPSEGETPQIGKSGPVNWANPEQLENLRRAFARSSISSVLEGDGLKPRGMEAAQESVPGEAKPGNGNSLEKVQQVEESRELNPNLEPQKRDISPELMTFSSDEEAEDSHDFGEEKGNPTGRKDGDTDGINTKSEQKILEMMPPWDADFWKIFGNNLRVYGCTEGVCQL